MVQEHPFRGFPVTRKQAPVFGISYFGVRNPEWVRLDMQRIRDAGFTHVLHTWSEEDLHYYGDTMAELVALTKSLGLGVYVNPWGIGRVFGGEAYSELTARNPAMAQVDSLGKPRCAACPNHPDFRTYMQRWVKTVCASDADSVFWDEPHFDFTKGSLDVWCCRCETCQRLYFARHGQGLPHVLTPELKAFREDSLIGFLEEMTSLVTQLGKRNSVCMLPPWFPAGLDDWSRVAALPCVDEIGSDPYWEKNTPLSEVEPTYRSTSQKVLDVATAHGKDAQMWIKNYHIVAGTEPAIELATRASWDAGIRNLFAWSYLGSSYLSWLRSDDPQLTWKTQCDAFQACRTRLS